MNAAQKLLYAPSTIAIIFFLLLAAIEGRCGSSEDYLSPIALAATQDGRTVYIACATANRVLAFDTATRKVTTSIAMPAPLTGIALGPGGTQVFVTCAGVGSKVCVVDTARGKVSRTLLAGHTAMAPVLSPDGEKLYVCNRFNDDVSVLELKTGREKCRIAVQREPTAADITRDGKFLLVANHLHKGRVSGDRAAAMVSVIDTAAEKVVKELELPDGSGLLNDLRVSPDGRYAVVTHVLSRFRLPATQLDRGWMNSNAATIIDLLKMEVVNTVLLDNVDRGAANPWGIGWMGDGSSLVIAHAGTHEISVIDFPALLEKLSKLPAVVDETKRADQVSGVRVRSDVPNDMGFLVGLRLRMSLPPSDLGPRAVVVAGKKVYIGNYFSDSLTLADFTSQGPKLESMALEPKKEMTLMRKGELYFHDARICFQGWQSCATCHPGQGRVDGVNWDLLNDGIGNPKNTKSLLLAHKTPPAMSMGVRETAETAVRAGIRHILFTVQPEEVPVALDEYLKSLKPVPSPFLVKGKLSPSARRGEKIFRDDRVGCASCHPRGLCSDLQSYDVGTSGTYDKPEAQFDTPSLVEAWRTAPYLHDGSALSIREVLTTRNRDNAHGKTSQLTASEIEDLVAYVLSL